jgi:hypothetical protein
LAGALGGLAGAGETGCAADGNGTAPSFPPTGCWALLLTVTKNVAEIINTIRIVPLRRRPLNSIKGPLKYQVKSCLAVYHGEACCKAAF